MNEFFSKSLPKEIAPYDRQHSLKVRWCSLAIKLRYETNPENNIKSESENDVKNLTLRNESENENKSKNNNTNNLVLDVFHSMSLLMLEQIKAKETALLHQVFTENAPIVESKHNIILMAISYLFEKYHGLYVALQQNMDELLMRIGPKNVFNFFKLNSFSLKPVFDKNYIQFFSINLVDSSNFSQFWINYPLLFENKTAKVFQSLFSCASPYPSLSKFILNQDSILTLTNQFLTNPKKSFVDIILVPCRTLIINGLFNPEHKNAFLKYTNGFPDLRVVTILTEYESLKNDINVFSEVTQQFADESSHPLIKDFMNRLVNDHHLCLFLQSATGRVTTDADLIENSIPKYLADRTKFEFDFSEYFDKNYFIISDKDRDMDFSFLYAYLAIKCILSNQDDIIDNLPNLLDGIKNKVVLENAVIDIFSLLFMMKDENVYVFSKGIMSEVVTILGHYSPKNKYIRKALLTLKMSYLISEKMFSAAKELFSGNENDPVYKISVIAEIISKVALNQPTTFPESVDKSLLAAEYYLSYNRDIGFETKHCPALIRRRKGLRLSSPLMLFDASLLTNIVNVLEEDIKSNDIDVSNFILLKGFTEIVKMSEKAGNKNLTLQDFISFVIQNDETSSLLTAKTVPEKYKDNKIIKSVILGKNSDYNQLNIKNTFAIPSKMTIENISDFLNRCDDQLYSIPDSDFKDLLNKSLSFRPLPFDLLNDLYFRNPQIVMLTYKPLLKTLTIAELMNLLPFCYYSCFASVSPSELTLIDELTDLVVKRKSFMKAKKMATEFGISQKLDAIIQSSASFEDLTDIEITFPHLREFVLKKRQSLHLDASSSTYSSSNSSSSQNEIKYLDAIAKMKKSPSFAQIISLFVDVRESFFAHKGANYSYGKVLYTNINSINTYNNSYNNSDNNNNNVSVLKGLSFNFISTNLMNNFVELTTNFISKINVNSIETEKDAMYQIPRIATMLNYFKVRMTSLSDASLFESLFTKFENLSRFVFCRFFSLYGENYTFDDFTHRSRGHEYALLCQKYDRVSLLRDIQNSWGLDNRYFESALNCFALGIIKDGLNLLRDSFNAHKALKIDCQPVADTLISSLSYPLPIHLGDLANNSNLKNDILKNSIKAIPSLKEEIQKGLANPDSLVLLNSPQIAALNETLSIIGALESQVQFHCKFGQFEEAFNKFSLLISNTTSSFSSPSFSSSSISSSASTFSSSISSSSSTFSSFPSISSSSSSSSFSSSAKVQLFLKILVTPALAFSQWNVFWRRLVRRIDELHLMPVLVDFVNILKSREMYHCLFDIQKRINFYDNAIFAAIKLFERVRNSWKSSQDLLSEMKSLIAKSLTDNAADKKKHQAFFSDESLFNLQQRANLQMSIISLFITKNIDFDGNLELMTSKTNTLKLASFLLLNLQVGYFSEVVELPDVNIQEICEVAIDTLANAQEEGKGEKAIPKFFKELTRLEFGTYRNIILCLVQSIYRRAADEKSFIEFVRRNVKGDELIAAVLQRFGFEAEAEEVLRQRSQK